MEVILKEDVERLGRSGDKVKVKEGYARNFLFPRKLALPATEGNLRAIEEEKRRKLAVHKKGLDEARELAEILAKASCTVTVKAGDADKLYGSVSAQDIASALELEGIKLDKKKIELQEHINQLGVYYVQVKLHPEVQAQLKVWVVKE